MMTTHAKCPTCHERIPETALACPYCLERKSLDALRHHQRQYLAKILTGEIELLARRVGSSPAQHLEMFGGSLRAFCGVQMAANGVIRGTKPVAFRYTPEAMEKICIRCRQQFGKLLAEAAQESHE
jgi:hypothetical protein